MKIKRKTFIFIGLVLGLLDGILIVSYSYIKAPTVPGIYELTVQFLIIAFGGVIGAVFGFVAAVVVGLFQRQSKL